MNGLQASITPSPDGAGRLSRVRALLCRLPRISSAVFAALATSWLVFAYNGPFFARVLEVAGSAPDARIGFALVAAAAVFAIFHLALSLVTWPYVGKAVVASLIVVGTIGAYFVRHYGVLIDAAMVQSVFQTDKREAAELLNASFAAYVLAWAVLPLAVVFAVPVRWARARREILYRCAGAAVSVSVIAGLAAVYFPQIASTLRNHRDLALLVTPTNVLRAVHKHVARTVAIRRPFERVGLDAAMARPAGDSHVPNLVVLVIGETARADHFSLGDYGRDTTPALKRQGVTWFPKVHSCGTATAVSVPCMFSDLGRERYDDAKAHAREGVLDVLQRAGYQVLWRDNNSGCKGVCDRVRSEDLSEARVPGLCTTEECYDAILLHELQARIDTLTGDAVIVLHQKGNHGPAYYRRYPAAFERFTPACRTPDLWRCDRESIANAYDNAILYTDHVLSETIELLKRNAGRFRTSLLYVSDHGESLGEGNVYLHGMPYALAPEAQKHVPMILWLSEQATQAQGVDRNCVDVTRVRAYSHDNLFHTLIGLAGVRTAAYRGALDALAPCRRSAQSANDA